MPKKLARDGLNSEISTVKALLQSAIDYGDIVGELQLKHRINELESELKDLNKSSQIDNTASVALFFGGKPVLGSKGIAAEFAGVALEQFQNLISKAFATNEVKELGTRGKVPFKENSNLMVTGLARGSFGFVLDEMSNQTQLESSELVHIIDNVALLLRDTAAQDEAIFEALLDDLDPRMLLALKEFFANLDNSKATLRVVEKELDMTLDGAAIHRAKTRTEATSIEEKTNQIEGILIGFLPEHRKFELKDNTGNIIYGSASREAVEQFQKFEQNPLGRSCLINASVKTVVPLNRSPKEVVRLVEFLTLH